MELEVKAKLWQYSKALNRIFFWSFDNIDNKVKNLVKIDLSDKTIRYNPKIR